MSLFKMICDYQDLLAYRDDLSGQVSALNDEIKATKACIAQQMQKEGRSHIDVDDYNFALVHRASYTRRSKAELDNAGINFLDVLREQGFGGLIIETVNANTLQSAMQDFVASHGKLSDALSDVIVTDEYNDVIRRKLKRWKPLIT